MLLNPHRFGSPGVVTIADGAYSHPRVDPLNSNPDFALASTKAFTGGPTVDSGSGAYNWLTGGNAADYDVRLTMISGTTFTGPAANSWWNLGTTRTWTLSQTVPGTKAGTGTIDIRPAGGGDTIDSATISLTAFVEA